MEADAQAHACQVERLLHGEAARGLGAAKDGYGSAWTKEPVKAGDRDVGNVVLIVAERTAEALKNADDGEIDALDLEGSAKGRADTGEEIVPEVIADNCNKSRAAIFRRTEEPAFGNAHVANIGEVGRSTDDCGGFGGQIASFDVDLGVAIGAVERGVPVEVFEVALVGQFELVVAAQLIENLSTATGVRDLLQNKRFAAESLGNAVISVQAQAIDGRADQNHAGHADDNAQKSEKAAQAVSAQGVESEFQCTEEH